MLRTLSRFTALVALATVPFVGSSDRVQAQAYPIDCAILLCLSGGWPASVPCARARAEFIRRITPWPVEPPLQIWRCPMEASYRGQGNDSVGGHIHDILLGARPPRLRLQSKFPAQARDANLPMPASFRRREGKVARLPPGLAHWLAQGRADIDISGPEFNFVRSIRVYDVRYVRQYALSRDTECYRSAAVVLGTYGLQGDFSWRGASPDALPAAHNGLERWGTDCPSIYHRAVFVDWRDFEGNYGFEQVSY
ncbi:hypothetical protein [Sedimentitalea sp.]|uniref:hypothetical protein n=1 Tax=Sedimentitalea sp. TaxID=2048915 RepID=UPI00329772B6